MKLKKSQKIHQGRMHTKIAPPHFSIEYMDLSVDPHEDFYRYASGRWINSHPVPKDKTMYSSFSELSDFNLECLRSICECCASSISPIKNSSEHLVGSFYKSAMNRARINKVKFGPIDMLYGKIDAIKSKSDVLRILPQLHLIGVGAFFMPFSHVDKMDSSRYAMYIYQSGTSLPDKEYYFLKGKNFIKIRREFKKHITKTFKLKGYSNRVAINMANSAFKIEMRLAKASRKSEDLRDTEKNYNKMSIKELSRYRTLDLKSYLNNIGAKNVAYVIIGQPEFLFEVDSILRGEIGDIKAYLKWALLQEYAPYLHKAMEEESFNFFRRILSGQKVHKKRWKIAVGIIDSMIGDALGKMYVDEYFSERARANIAELVDDVISVFNERIGRLEWMSEKTRSLAREKLKATVTKIGAPKRFKRYLDLEILEDDFAGNVMRSQMFEMRRQILRAGKKVDKNEFSMTPPTVNAYYSQERVEIVFPAGILQPPFFDEFMDPAVNYGAIAGVIGHELTHGFDDQGRKYDKRGNINNWWGESDVKSFNALAQKVVDLYSSIEAMPGMFINGNLTLGENIADMGGISIAFDALMRKLERSKGKANAKINGFTPQQRFFISWAQIWRSNAREEELHKRILSDPHSPAKFRAIIPPKMHPYFDKAFPLSTVKKSQKEEQISI